MKCLINNQGCRGKESCLMSETKGCLCYLENYMYNKAKEG